MASVSVTPAKRSWHSIIFGSYASASVELMELFEGVSTIDFNVVTTNPDLATIPKLFKLSANISAHGYCQTPFFFKQTIIKSY